MTFENYLQAKKKPIEKAIHSALILWQKEIAADTPDLKVLSDILLESNQGGKNIRGTLVCLGYELFTAKKNQDIFIIAAAYEILQTSLLIHDDIIDKSLLRRGKETVFQKLGGNHYGISQGICLGDIGFFIATQMISRAAFPDAIKVKVLSHFSQIVLDTSLGQMLDIKFANNIGSIDEETVVKIAELKTARYTISGPLALGALAAGADPKHLDALSFFGKHVGIAFQIKDDILGIFGDEKTVGKSATSDIEEGKNTLLIVHAFTYASAKQKKELLQYYGSGKITEKQQTVIKNIFEETGSLGYAEKKALEYNEKAKESLGNVTRNENNRKILESFISFLMTRQK